jgi:NAD(P)-dependent dehydrogenase (short-subunit alcohol dehydrogenase family)
MSPSHSDEDDSSLRGKVALVTGGAQGIGRAIAVRFQKAGARVYLVDRDQVAGALTASELTSFYPQQPVKFIPADLERLEEVKAVTASFRADAGQLDVLVNNAGVELDKRFEDVTASDWDKLLAINLRAPFLLTQSLLSVFAPAGGAIINISSIHSTHAFANATAYACSKAGLVALTRNLALELAPRHIRVNALCPGYIDTRLWDDYLRSSPDAAALAAETAALHPIGRRGVPTDVAEAALFLASDRSSFITGTQLVVDGGLTIRAHP